jgi:hypothetical protein
MRRTARNYLLKRFELQNAVNDLESSFRRFSFIYLVFVVNNGQTRTGFLVFNIVPRIVFRTIVYNYHFFFLLLMS